MDVPAVECNRVEEGVGGCFVPIGQALVVVRRTMGMVVVKTGRYDGGTWWDFVG